MPFDERMRDTLPCNLPYDGWVAEAYELFMPHDAPYWDDALWRRRIERCGGTALELGCGTGRLLLRYVEAGLDVEGIDVSADMLAICRANARARGIAPVLHRGSIAPLQLDRQYALLFCPAASFTLFHERDVARDALRSYRAHVLPEGEVHLALHVPWSDMDANHEWRVRRTATRPTDGVTVMVHEAVACRRAEQVIDSLTRYEWWDADGRLVDTRMRRHRLRWWYPDEFVRELTDAGFEQTRIDGNAEAFVAVGRAGT
jgi:SAM-dependent methyltransferase